MEYEALQIEPNRFMTIDVKTDATTRKTMKLQAPFTYEECCGSLYACPKYDQAKWVEI